MRAVVQRVEKSSVRVDADVIGEIGTGLLVLLGIAQTDETGDADYICNKVSNLRIFEDDNGKMNRSVIDINGEILVVSQFTLLGDCRKGRRPSFIEAAGPEQANLLYKYFVDGVKKMGIPVATGKFQAMMSVSLINDGPVTLILDSKEKK
jgi:D-aminoacyl-tRNA deacylase